MATEAAGPGHVPGPVARFLPSLAPALLISMGFIDLGKWIVAVEGGAQFGFNPVLLVLLFNFSAIFCQYLATCIGAVSGKNLAQICGEEYDRSACLLLGIQAEISRVVSDISTILGIAHGFNLLFGVELLACTILAAIIASVLPIVIKVFGKHTTEVQFAGISGFVLLFCVVAILSAQPDVPVVMTGTFPLLSLENSYLVMALLGSNIIVHNFYFQSLMVQQRRCFNGSVDYFLHDHFLALLFTFSGIFLVNCVLMNLATSLFENAGLTFQDIFLQMDQMFTFRIAPVAFFLVLFLSSLISVFTWVFGGHVVINELFGFHVSFWIHLACSKVAVVVPAIYYARVTGAEGLYQLLIFCQVALALLLPSSVIPLFRVASSQQWMGTYTMSWYLEILALFTFIWMFSSNLVFITEVFFGNGSWIISLRSNMLLLFFLLVFVACMSLGLTLYLMVTPLKSASTQSKWELKSKEQLHAHGHAIETSSTDFFEVRETDVKSASFGYEELPVLKLDYNAESLEVISESLKEYGTATDLNQDAASASSASDILIKESNFSVDLHALESADKLLSSSIPELGICEQTESNEPLAKEELGMESASVAHKGEDTAWGHADLPAESLPPVAIDSSEQLKSYTCKSNDTSSGAGSLSRLSGLGRAAWRQFAATLDEFWGHLFDFHGQLTQEARTNKVDILLGLDVKNVFSAKADVGASEGLRNYATEKERGLGLQANPRDYSFSNQKNVPHKGSLYGYQTASSSWFSGSQADMYGRIPSNDTTELGERRYSSLHLPQHLESRDYQPATIHGYQISSYLKGMGGGGFDPSGFQLDQPLSPKSQESSIANYGEQLKFGMGHDGFSSLGTPAFDGLRSFGTSREAELSSYDSSFSGIYEGSTNSEKRYHSLPDISGRTLSSRNTLGNRNFGQNARLGPQPVGRTAFGPSQFTSPNYRSEGAHLTFDELSPSTNYKDIFLSQSNTGADKSLWSRQPYEQLFGLSTDPLVRVDGTVNVPGLTQYTFSYVELESKLLVAFKDCIMKILKLEGSDWLFKENAGTDEELIDQLVLKEKFLLETGINETNTTYFNEYQDLSSERELSSVDRTALDFRGNGTVVKCGENCIWRAGLIVSFGVWCIGRILDLSLVESRPELWGKYTYVLNRLQGILEPAFSRPRSPITSCPCVEIPVAYMDYDRRNQSSLPQRVSIASGSRCTTSAAVLDLIKDVELAISGRKGRSGTAAGDVAFPKGKENLASVLKRYKRRLSSKSSATMSGGSSSRKFPLPTALVS